MKPLVPLVLAAMLAFTSATAFAEEAEPKKKPAKKARAPADSTAVDRRVAGASTIFIGEGMWIYFIDRRYQEVPYIRAVGEGANKSALIAVKVVKVLHPPNAELPAKVLVPVATHKGDIASDAPSPYDDLVGRYVGKQNIWFGELAVRSDYGDDKSGRKPLEDPLTFLQAWDSKKRPIVSALPIEQLKNVEGSIKRVKKGRDEGGGMRDEKKTAATEEK